MLGTVISRSVERQKHDGGREQPEKDTLHSGQEAKLEVKGLGTIGL